jgi:hypothetical protein
MAWRMLIVWRRCVAVNEAMRVAARAAAYKNFIKPFYVDRKAVKKTTAKTRSANSEESAKSKTKEGGPIVLAFVGFNYGGWVTTGTAEAMAKETAANAVAERLASICLAQFNRDSENGQKLKEMKEEDSWDKARYVEEQSWAIMPGEEKPDSRVADACAKQLAAKA